MKLNLPFLRGDMRRNKDNGVIRSEGSGQFKHSAHLVDSADKREAVKVAVREIGALNTHAPTARSYLQRNKNEAEW